MEKQTRDSHPSYGAIQICRVSGHTPIFGSSILHNSYIALKISRAEMVNDMAHSHLFPRETIVEVKLSHTQFGEFISSMNQGVGVPCTLHYINHEQIADPPFESKVAHFRKEYKDTVEEMVKGSKEDEEKLKEILAKPSIGKADRQEILNRYHNFSQRVSGNLPFLDQMFSEQMEKTAQEAKGEVESFVEQKLRTIGLEKMKSNFLQLEAGETKGDVIA